MSAGYFMRLNQLDGYGEKVTMMKMCDDYEKIAVVKHRGDSKENPHYHLVIQTSVKAQAFRVRMKKTFPDGKGNGHMSIKEWDGSMDCLSYLFHEEPDCDLFMVKGFTDYEVQSARDRNARVQEEISKSKEKASWRLENVVYEHFKKLGGMYPDDRSVAVEVLLTAWRDGKYAPNDYLLKAIVGKILFRLRDGDVQAEESLAWDVVNKIYRY